MKGNEQHWVVAFTYPGDEQKVQQRYAQLKPPIECYLPLVRRFEGGRYTGEVAYEPMFPCYLFLKINQYRIYDARTARGVIKLLSKPNFDTGFRELAEVTESEMNAIRAFEETHRKFYLHESSKLVKGATATILSGEFKGMTGRLVKACKDGNFCITIEAVGKSFVTRISRSELKPSEMDSEPDDYTSMG